MGDLGGVSPSPVIGGTVTHYAYDDYDYDN